MQNKSKFSVLDRTFSWLLSISMLFGVFVFTDITDNNVNALSKSEIQNKLISILYKNSGGRISCDFDGYVNTQGKHEGIDFAKGRGSAVYSLIDGKVIYVNNTSSSSSLSTLSIYDEKNDKSVIYLHTADICVSTGNYVKQGDLVAYESDRGAGGSPHTHIEVRDGWKQKAAKSVNDYTLENSNPYPYWEKVLTQNPYVDIGTDFVATINEVKANQPLKTVNGNIQIGSSNGNVDEKWWFIRQSDGSYIIESIINNNYVTTGGTGNGSNVTTSKYTGSDAQKWYLYSVNGNYELAPKNSTGQRMNVAGGGTGDGTNIITWQAMSGSTDIQFKINKCGTKYIYNLGTDFVAAINDVKVGKPFKAASNGNVELTTSKGNIDEKWWFIRQADGTYIIESLYNNNYITASGTGNGSNVTTSKYTGSDSQKWYVYPSNGKYELAPKNSTGQRMNIAGGGTGDGTNIITWQEMSGSNDTRFSIVNVGSRYIYNLGSEFVANINDVKVGKPLKSVNGNVELGTASGSLNEKWYFTRQADGSYFIQSLSDNNYVTVSGGGSKNGTNIITSKYTGGNEQRWFVYPYNNKFELVPKCAMSSRMNLSGGSTNDKTNIALWQEMYGSNDNLFNISNKAALTSIKFTVSYNINGGSGSIGNQTKTYGQDLTLSSTKPTRTGYEFVGWNTNASATTAQYSAGGKYTANSGTTLYAIWKAKQVTVTFYRNQNGSDNTTATQTFTYGVNNQSFSNKNWSKDGYTLLGWSENRSATDKQYDAYSGVSWDWINSKSSNVNLYAVWKANTYTVSYNMNGGSGSIGNQTKTYGQDLTLSSTKPTRTGYDFVGWNTNASATTAQYSAGGKYTANSGATLYAIWKKIDENLGTYKYANPNKTTLYARISYNGTDKYLTNLSDNASNDKSYKNVQLKTKNDTVQQVWEFEKLSDGGYKISSVYDGRILDIYNTKTDNGTNIGACGTYYANGGQIWYLIKKDGKYVIQPKVSTGVYLGVANANDGGNVQITTSSHLFNIEILKPVGTSSMKAVQEGTSTSPTKFTWTSATDATWYNLYIYDGEVWKSNCIYSQKNIKALEWSVQLKPGTYQAHLSPINVHNWTNSNVVSFTVKADTYTISYNMNGGSGSIGNQTKTYGQDLTLSSTIPIKTGCIFLGWNTDKNAATAQYQVGSKYTANSGTTLYAVWKAIDYNAVPTVKGNFDGHTYEYYSQSMNWDQAYKFCEKKGGHLVTIGSKAENDFVVELTKDSNDSLWIGGKTQDYKTWFWITGEPFDYENWSEGEPNNYGGNQSVIKLYRSGKWDDDGSSYNHGFICEYEDKIDASNYTPVYKENYNGHEYWFFENAVDWQTAEKVCEAKGGHLVIIDSAEENDMVLSGMKKTAKSETWIGITDIAQEGVWKDVKGNLLSYTNWSGGQPDNYQDREDYAHLYDNGKWNDEKSYRAMYCSVGFVCEFDDLCTGSGHKYTETIVAPTTTAQGYTLHTCSVCGSSYKDNYKDKLSVKDYISGDINNDGVVNNKDFSRLFQYLSGWNVVVNEAALDVNGDGSVNNKDATRLFQYVSGWSVTIY